MSATVELPMKLNRPDLYHFGYSLTDDILTVQNWQTGNNVFLSVQNGTIYFFAKPILQKNSNDYLRVELFVNCGDDRIQVSNYSIIEAITGRIEVASYSIVSQAEPTNTGSLITGIEI